MTAVPSDQVADGSIVYRTVRGASLTFSTVPKPSSSTAVPSSSSETNPACTSERTSVLPGARPSAVPPFSDVNGIPTATTTVPRRSGCGASCVHPPTASERDQRDDPEP